MSINYLLLLSCSILTYFMVLTLNMIFIYFFHTNYWRVALYSFEYDNVCCLHENNVSKIQPKINWDRVKDSLLIIKLNIDTNC